MFRTQWQLLAGSRQTVLNKRMESEISLTDRCAIIFVNKAKFTTANSAYRSQSPLYPCPADSGNEIGQTTELVIRASLLNLALLALESGCI